jgi:hypothetical protein
VIGVAWRCDESRILCAHVLHDAKIANVNSLKVSVFGAKALKIDS